jgi:hypothetical protein
MDGIWWLVVKEEKKKMRREEMRDGRPFMEEWGKLDEDKQNT